MEQVFQALIDRSRAPLDLKTIRTILGYQRRPRYRKRKKHSAQWEVAVERPVYDLTIFKLHCGKLTLKIYTKGERVLRIEAIAHNTQELGCGRSLEKFPEIVLRLKALLENFLEALSCIDQCFIADEMLEHLPAPSRVGNTKVGGIDLNKARMRLVTEAVIALSASPEGFTASELAGRVRALSKQGQAQYGPRHAAYDLKKLRGKQIVRRIGQTRSYQPLPSRSEGDDRAGCSQKQSHQTSAGRRSAAHTNPGSTQPQSHRPTLRCDPSRHARRISRAGPSRMNIDNIFFGHRP